MRKQLVVQGRTYPIYVEYTDDNQGWTLNINGKEYSTLWFGVGISEFKILKGKILLIASTRDLNLFHNCCEVLAREIQKEIGEIPHNLQIILQF